MSVSFSANVVFGLPIMLIRKTVKKTKYDENTGKPYETEESESETVIGGAVVSLEWLDKLKKPIGEYTTGMSGEDIENGVVGILGISLAKSNMDYSEDGVKEVKELSYTERLDFEAFCNKNGIVGEPKLYLVGYVG